MHFSLKNTARRAILSKTPGFKKTVILHLSELMLIDRVNLTYNIESTTPSLGGHHSFDF
jgi:hypothetical protein